MDLPNYRIPISILPGLIMDVLLGKRRSFRLLALECIRELDPPLKVMGKANIPVDRPAVLTVNHYHRPGFNAEWLALAVSSVIPQEIHWIITAELTFPGKWYEFLGRPLSRFILNRTARIFGFTTMPPMPPREQDLLNRAASIRAVLKYVRHSAIPLIGLAPEGGDNPAQTLADPPAGFGRFAMLLADLGLQLLPVGVYEQHGSLCVHFGKVYKITWDPRQGHELVDQSIARMIMEHLACLLPSELSSDFSPDPIN